MPGVKKKKPQKVFANQWVLDSFEGRSDFFQKRMFGGLAAYLHGRMMLVLMESPGDREYRGKRYSFDLWNGVLLPTEWEFHASLKEEFENLLQHPVLGKWLYLKEADDRFEETITRINELVVADDRRFGIYPKVKARKKSSKKKQTR